MVDIIFVFALSFLSDGNEFVSQLLAAKEEVPILPKCWTKSRSERLQRGKNLMPLRGRQSRRLGPILHVTLGERSMTSQFSKLKRR
jgi:hypothetical protein